MQLVFKKRVLNVFRMQIACDMNVQHLQQILCTFQVDQNQMCN